LIAVGRIGLGHDAVRAGHAVRERPIERVLKRARGAEDNVCGTAERAAVVFASAIGIGHTIDRERALSERIRCPKRCGNRD
jgi:hypothetical protein